MGNDKKVSGSVVVVGGGIGGVQASLDLAEQGFKVYLVEKGPSIGGIMAQLDKTFPTNDCSMCILAPKLVTTGRHPNIEVITNAEVEGLAGEAGNFVVAVKKNPRYVDLDKCTGCGDCMKNCPVTKMIYPVEEKPAQLSKDDLQKINAILNEHREEIGNLMPTLQQINREFNYLPSEVLRHVSKELNISLSDIYNIATFYNAFSLIPRGRHQISVCMGTTCYVRGGERILDRVSEELEIAPGETTKDMRFSLNSVRCIGCCSLAPAIMIDEKVYGRLKLNQIPKILRKYE
ncbi:NADH-quinone oxidoreductase subunit NuoE [candidate division WOR-3 bacterium]|nr:NADH-quinone oxidoreductase subunit NuoE [candidate division WOR-3 bacterium]